jgi:hypothetical protein
MKCDKCKKDKKYLVHVFCDEDKYGEENVCIECLMELFK